MALNENLENIVMMIIADAGAARSAAFHALAEAKKGDFEKTKEFLADSNTYARKAHSKHSELLAMYAKGEVEQSDILIAHAQDHLMCAELAKELISEIIELREMIERR